MVKDENYNGDLWAGWANEQVKGDDQYNYGYKNWLKYRSSAEYPQPQPTTAPIKNSFVTAGALEKFLNQAVGNATPTTPVGGGGVITNAGGGLAQFFAENKYLVLGGLALVAYLMFSGGGSLAEKSVITRYNKR